MGALNWLLEQFTDNAPAIAMIWRDQFFTYGNLLDEIERWRTRLASSNIHSSAVVALGGECTPTAVAALLALIELDAIVVPLTASVKAHEAEFMESAEVQYSLLLRGDEDDQTVEITEYRSSITNPVTRSLIDQHKSGLVLFSSGSTGKHKAVLHNLAALLEKFKVRRQTLITLAFLLFDHIGGLNTLFYTLSNGGTLVTPQSRDPEHICQMIEHYKVELLPTSPTFLNLLLISEAYKDYDLTSLRRITYGTEIMPTQTLKRIQEILPTVELQQTYGLSELGILRSKSRSVDSLWVKVGGEGFEVKIQDSILWVRAQSAMVGYLNAPSPFDAEGWFNTGDIVEVDGDYVRFLGRASEIINVGGTKVYPAEVENVLMQLPNVRDVVVSALPNPITGQSIVARFNLFEPEEIGQLRKRVREFCHDRLATYKIPTKIEIVTDVQYSQRYKRLRR